MTERNQPAALVTQAVTAVRILTFAPPAPSPEALGASAVFFPAVGLLLGAVLLAADHALGSVAPPLRALVLVALLGVLTGARPRGRWSTGGAPAAVAARRERAILAASVLAKIAALAALAGPGRGLALLLAPTLGRWALVAVAFGSRPVPPDDRAAALVRGLTFREFALASVFALGLTLGYAEARGLVAVLLLAAGTLGTRGLLHATRGGVGGGALGVTGEVAETVALVVFALTGAGGFGGP